MPLAALGLLFALGEAVAGPEPPALDRELLDWVGAQISGSTRDWLLLVYQLSGKTFTPVLVLALLLLLGLRRRWRDLMLLCTSTAGILLLVDLVLKPLFDRIRPIDALIPLDGRSFPSGHAAGSIAFYVAVVVITTVDHPRRRWPLSLLTGTWVLLIWLSTLVVRAHWPSDLIAGGAVGLAWLSLCLAWWRLTPWPPPHR